MLRDIETSTTKGREAGLERTQRIERDKARLLTGLGKFPGYEAHILDAALRSYSAVLEQTGLPARGVLRAVKGIRTDYWNKPFEQRIDHLANLRSLGRETRNIPVRVIPTNTLAPGEKVRLP